MKKPIAPIFQTTVSWDLGHHEDRTPYMRWLNQQHAPEFNGHAPPQGQVSEAHMDAAYALHRGRQLVIEGEVQKDGNLKPLRVYHHGVWYILTPQN